MTAQILLALVWGSPSIAEIQASPSTGIPEWIEVAGDPGADLGGWTIDDGVSLRAIPAGTTLPEGGVLVLSSNCAGLRAAWPGADIACVEPAGWNRLSVDSERVVLRDRNGAASDSVVWTAEAWGPWPQGRSRERRVLDAGACDPANWVPSSRPGGTPGWIPSVISPGIGSLGIHPVGKIAVPGTIHVLEVSAQAGVALRVELCDMRRRVVRTLWDASPPPEGRIEWDARSGGRSLNPGVYGLIARSGSASVRTWLVVGAPGK